ncbi:MAG: hypothetical protein QXM22_02590 [Candidatus Bathyarchaeia archaeon]
MPSIIPAYVYMFAAMTAVGTLLIFSFNSYAATLRFIPETEQLDNLLSCVAAKATELQSLTTANSNTQGYLNLPSKIGDKSYWLRLRNDTVQSWVEGGFGEITENTVTNHRVYLAGKPYASGQYTSGFGIAVLKSFMNGSVVQIYLTNAREDRN